jgi:manganese transport protein
MSQQLTEKSMSELHQSVSTSGKRGFWRSLLAFIGPAYLVSVGYMDPGNWATDIAAGSTFGYKLIWILVLSNAMAILLQSLSARLGIVKGWDLAQASRQQYAPWANYSLYALAEIAIIACDLAEIIGMAIGLKLLFNIPLSWGVIITALDTFLLLFLLNKGVRKLEAFILVLIAIIGVSFIVEMFIVKPDLGEVAKGVIPSDLGNGALYIAIAMIGATVMPHNLYLHSSLVQTRKFSRDDVGIRKAIKYNFIDSAVALNLALFVNVAILILAGSAFYNNGYTRITGIEEAHLLLENIFGALAPAIFAIALIAAGQSSTITGTLAGQIVMEGYLNLRITPWIRRLVTRCIAIAPALYAIYYYGDSAMNDLLVFSQVVLSMQLGFAVIPLIHFTASKHIMGKFAISKPVQFASWLAAFIIVVLNLLLVWDELSSMLPNWPVIIQLIGILASIFFIFLLGYIALHPLWAPTKQQDTNWAHKHAETITIQPANPYNHIVLALEFGSIDQRIINKSIMLGGKTAQYTIIHIVETAGAIQMGADIVDAETKKDYEMLESLQHALVSEGYTVSISLGFGKPAHAIPDLVNTMPCDLLVMGAHGHSGWKDFLFGATVDKVRHKVKVPVLIVK